MPAAPAARGKYHAEQPAGRRGDRRRSFVSGPVVAPVTAAIVVAFLPGTSRSDTIMLRGGGQVEGKVVPDPKDKDRVQVWLLKGRKPLSFRKGQILEVISKASALDEYFEQEEEGRRDASGAVRPGHLVRAEQAPRPGQAALRERRLRSTSRSSRPTRSLGMCITGATGSLATS